MYLFFRYIAFRYCPEFCDNAYESQINIKRFVCTRWMQYEARSRFTLSTTRDPSSPRLRLDKVYLRRPNEDGALQKWLSATSTAPHGDVRREIAHNAPPPVGFFYKKWDGNNCLFNFRNRYDER